jgi:hypothetical protein
MQFSKSGVFLQKKACGSRLDLNRSGTLLVCQDVGFLNVFTSGSVFLDLDFLRFFWIWIGCDADIKLLPQNKKNLFECICF